MLAAEFKSEPVYVTAAELGVAERYCTCCNRDLSGHAVRMLELDQRHNVYHDFRGVPENKSQGWFPFGLACAKKKTKEAISKMRASDHQ